MRQVSFHQSPKDVEVNNVRSSAKMNKTYTTLSALEGPEINNFKNVKRENEQNNEQKQI